MLNKIAAVVFILGTIALILISDLEPRIIKISEIDRTYLDKPVKIRGKVVSLMHFYNFMIFTLEEGNSTISVKLNKNIEINKNQFIEVTGKVILYKENLEIEARKITFLD